MPFIESVRKVDMRERVISTPSQEMITQDNAVVTVDAVIFVQINTPEKTIYEIQEPILAVSNLSITTLRSIIGTMTLDQVLGERSKINTKVQTELSHETAKR
jgi:regulator of protease activity HflC (stomatin/prohibitin superfamily)